MLLFRQHWFNIICMIRDDGIYYYCNLSSPFIIDQEGLKYIDYDLDVKLYPDGEVLILDRDEYDYNIKDMHYPEEIIQIIKSNLSILLEFIKEKKNLSIMNPFIDGTDFSRESEKRRGKKILRYKEYKSPVD